MAETAENWDLHAVVRSCSSSAIDATTSSSKYVKEITATTDPENNNNPLSFLSSLKFEEEEEPFSFPNLLQERSNGIEELQESYKPFFPTNIGPDDIIVSSSSSSSCALGGLTSQKHQQLTTSISTSTDSPLTPTSSSPIFVFGEPKSQRSRHVQPQQQRLHQDLQLQQQQQQPGASNCLRPMQSQAPRSRKRKTPQKRMVCHVTEENLSSDLWAWRKYGQKPIKGSPYPRNYYRCSSSKGCAARKQVERCNTDPDVFIVSYTGDHTHPRPTHRNSLAGSSRNKFSRAQNPPSRDSSTSTPLTVAKASCSSPLSSTSRSPTPEEEKNNTVENGQLEGADDMDNEMLMEELDDEDELLIPNLAAAMNEDLFKGFDAPS